MVFNYCSDCNAKGPFEPQNMLTLRKKKGAGSGVGRCDHCHWKEQKDVWIGQFEWSADDTINSLEDEDIGPAVLSSNKVRKLVIKLSNAIDQPLYDAMAAAKGKSKSKKGGGSSSSGGFGNKGGSDGFGSNMHIAPWAPWAKGKGGKGKKR